MPITRASSRRSSVRSRSRRTGFTAMLERAQGAGREARVDARTQVIDVRFRRNIVRRAIGTVELRTHAAQFVARERLNFGGHAELRELAARQKRDLEFEIGEAALQIAMRGRDR